MGAKTNGHQNGTVSDNTEIRNFVEIDERQIQDEEDIEEIFALGKVHFI